MGHVLVIINVETLKLLLLLLLLLVFVFSSKALNITKFCVKNPNNILCVYPDVEGNELCESYEPVPIDESGIRDIIIWHKQARENVTDLEPSPKVYWNTFLALMAQSWASKCKPMKDANVNFDKNTVYQNIFRLSAIDGMNYNLSDVLKMYEYRTLHEGPVRNGTSKDILKKINLWKSFRIGCAMSKYNIYRIPGADEDKGNSGVKVHEIVCNYTPLRWDGRNTGRRAWIKKRSERSNLFETHVKKVEKNSSTFSLYGNGYGFEERYGEIHNEGGSFLGGEEDGENEGKRGKLKDLDAIGTSKDIGMKDGDFEKTSKKEFNRYFEKTSDKGVDSKEDEGSLDLNEFDKEFLPLTFNLNNETRMEFQRYLPPDPTMTGKSTFALWAMRKNGGCTIKSIMSTSFGYSVLFFIGIFYSFGFVYGNN